MIISVDKVLSIPEFQNMNRNDVQNKLDAIEVLVRKYTNNNFQNKNIRFLASSMIDRLNAVSPFLKLGVTFQI